MASLQPAADIPMQVRSETSFSERRISPSWTIAHFKSRLEPITGIPTPSQRLALKLGGSQADVSIEAPDEDTTQLAAFALQPYAEISVTDTRPAHLRQTFDPTALPAVEKYTMPPSQYSALPNSVLAYKRANHLGRFDPSAPSAQQAQIDHFTREAAERHIAVGRRCRLLPPPREADGGGEGVERRGEVAFLGELPELPGVGVWVGVRLDEPMGKNDGTVKGRVLFECGGVKRGVLVRPERVEVGDFAVVDELGDMEEI